MLLLLPVMGSCRQRRSRWHGRPAAFGELERDYWVLVASPGTAPADAAISASSAAIAVAGIAEGAAVAAAVVGKDRAAPAAMGSTVRWEHCVTLQGSATEVAAAAAAVPAWGVFVETASRTSRLRLRVIAAAAAQAAWVPRVRKKAAAPATWHRSSAPSPSPSAATGHRPTAPPAAQRHRYRRLTESQAPL